LRAKVLGLEEKLFDDEVNKIILPATNGEMCILKNHTSIVTSLKKGVIKIFRTANARPLVISIYRGVCSFHKNNAIIILEHENSTQNNFTHNEV
jgi:F0F1-type ATP synthase epsilon subunit